MRPNRTVCLYLTLLAGMACLGFYASLGEAQRATQPDRVKLTADAPKDLSGFYSVKGEDGLDGGETKAYRGITSIQKIKHIYAVTNQSGQSSTKGIGVLKDNIFAVGWTGADGKIVGVSIYNVQGKSLKGSWASIPGSGVPRPETLNFVSGLDDEETKEPPLAACPCGPDCKCDPCDCHKAKVDEKDNKTIR